MTINNIVLLIYQPPTPSITNPKLTAAPSDIILWLFKCFFFSYPALQVQVITATVQQSNTLAELKCHSSCSPAGVSYIWFKNNKKIPKTTRSSYKGFLHHADMISCALEGHEDFPSPAVCEFTHKHTH